MKQQDCDLKVEEHTQDIGEGCDKRSGSDSGVNMKAVKNQRNA
jgi:hypothetical protein